MNAAPITPRQRKLQAILHQFPGNDCATQRARLLAAMQGAGSVTTHEAMRILDCYDPRPRIYELRHKEGYLIQMQKRAEPTESGELHHIGVYTLEVGR